MRKTLVGAVVLATLCGGCGSGQKAGIQSARLAENQGKRSEAINLYAAALFAATPAQRLPDISGSVTLSLEAYRGQVAQHVTRVLDDTTKPGIEAQSILVALDRCTIGVENQTRIRRFAVTPATADTFAQYWRSALFPDNVALHDDQRPLIEQARAAGMSVVTLAPWRSGIAYEGRVINRTTGKSWDVKLYREGTTAFLVRPGVHALILRSTVDYSSGETWQSPYAYLAFVAPEKPSIVAIQLETRVDRK